MFSLTISEKISAKWKTDLGLVRVPTLFSRYFGDNVGEIATSLGAKDESKIAEKL